MPKIVTHGEDPRPVKGHTTWVRGIGKYPRKIKTKTPTHGSRLILIGPFTDRGYGIVGGDLQRNL